VIPALTQLLFILLVTLFFQKVAEALSFIKKKRDYKLGLTTTKTGQIRPSNNSTQIQCKRAKQMWLRVGKLLSEAPLITPTGTVQLLTTRNPKAENTTAQEASTSKGSELHLTEESRR
jgi:hypothetical protein